VERVGLQRLLEKFLGLLVVLALQIQCAERFERVGMIRNPLEQLLAKLLRLGVFVVFAIQVEEREITVEPIGSEGDGFLVALLGARLERAGLVLKEREERIRRLAATFAMRAGVLRQARPEDGLGSLADLAGPELRRLGDVAEETLPALVRLEPKAARLQGERFQAKEVRVVRRWPKGAELTFEILGFAVIENRPEEALRQAR